MELSNFMGCMENQEYREIIEGIKRKKEGWGRKEWKEGREGQREAK